MKSARVAVPDLVSNSYFPAIAAIAVLVVQAFAFDGVAPRATLVILSAAFFVFSIALGRRMSERRDDSLAWIAKSSRSHSCARRAAGRSTR